MTARPRLECTPGSAARAHGRRGRAPRVALSMLIASCCIGAAGCGEAAVATRTAPHQTTATATVTPKPDPATPRPSPAAAKHSALIAKMDVSSDAIIAEGKVHIASGAPSDAEVRREIAAARKAGIQLPSGDTAASFENAPANSGAGLQIETPETSWNPRAKPIADWIIPVLTWAAAHGWTGTVTSGYRTFYEQEQLNAAGAFSAPAGVSNHETTVYPGGAVDVTNSSQLIAVLRGYTGPLKLIGGVLGPADPEHFSATGD